MTVDDSNEQILIIQTSTPNPEPPLPLDPLEMQIEQRNYLG
jgi:hypothetical protein